MQRSAYDPGQPAEELLEWAGRPEEVAGAVFPVLKLGVYVIHDLLDIDVSGPKQSFLLAQKTDRVGVEVRSREADHRAMILSGPEGALDIEFVLYQRFNDRQLDLPVLATA